MSDSGGNSITIPDNVKKTIQSIREITGKKHSDEDVYSVLQDCSMDPDDTAQKLLYLDTFHEVKRKCDWRKGTRGRGTRGGQGNFSDAVGGRNVATRRENGVVRMADRSASNSLHSVQKKNNTAVNPVTKSSIRSHGPQLPAAADAGSSAHTVKSDAFLPPAACTTLPMQVSVSVMLSKERKSTTFFNGLPASTTLASVSGSVSSSSDPILAPSMTRNPGAVGTIKREVGCQRKAAEQNNIQGNKKISLSKSKAVGNNQLSESLQPSTLSTYNDSLVVRSSANDSHSSEELAKSLKILSEDAQAKVSSQLLPEPSITIGHVKFPTHFKVPEALKSSLTFGSFESNSGPGKEYINGGLTFGSFDSNSGPETKCSNAIDGDINSTLAVELTTVENARPSRLVNILCVF
uniref:GBF-interacting protein 1 N-terminal domain-containing protein n=1 Tax=Populus trichocarpa TaxID=3694 RepID=A0A3N7FVI5_POPTR